MADVALSTQVIDVDGHSPTYTSPNTTDTYKTPNDGRTFYHARKTGAGSCNMTIATPIAPGGLSVADRVVVVPATTGNVMIGPFPRTVYGEELAVTFSEVTGLTVAALRIG